MDADMNRQIKYSIDFGNQKSFFSIDETTGEITLEQIIPLETHQTEEFLLLVKATDGRSLQFPPEIYKIRSICFGCLIRNFNLLFLGGVVPRSASVQVKVNAVGDTKPHFIQNIYKHTIEEERDPGTVIVKVRHDDYLHFYGR